MTEYVDTCAKVVVGRRKVEEGFPGTLGLPLFPLPRNPIALPNVITSVTKNPPIFQARKCEFWKLCHTSLVMYLTWLICPDISKIETLLNFSRLDLSRSLPWNLPWGSFDHVFANCEA